MDTNEAPPNAMDVMSEATEAATGMLPLDMVRSGSYLDDVHGRESLDLLCRRGGEILHVEVRGTTTAGTDAILTPNEVRYVRDHGHSALFILSGIMCRSNILRAAGIDPAPRRAGSDLAAVLARPGRRDRRGRLPARGHRATEKTACPGIHRAWHRRMHLGGVTASPTGQWTVQQARNLALGPGERLEGIKFLIRDRGPNFTASFDAITTCVAGRGRDALRRLQEVFPAGLPAVTVRWVTGARGVWVAEADIDYGNDDRWQTVVMKQHLHRAVPSADLSHRHDLPDG